MALFQAQRIITNNTTLTNRTNFTSDRHFSTNTLRM